MRTRKSADTLIAELKSLSQPENLAGMARFGVDTSLALGVSMPNIRAIGKTAIKDHALAQALWDSEIHEARILASVIDIASEVTREQMDAWAGDFNSWDVCDQVCGNLFDRSPYADEMIVKWATDPREYVKRAAFALIAWRAVHLKKEPDEIFLAYLPLIAAASNDERNFVKKAVNWALRQIGKRSASLHKPALELAHTLQNSDEKATRWIGQDAVKELEGEAILKRLGLA